MDDESDCALRAATFDELLGACGTAPESQDADALAARLAAWCRASTHNDWELFARRLERDNWNLDLVRRRFSATTISDLGAAPWVRDSRWIRAAFKHRDAASDGASLPFAHLFTRVIETADTCIPYPGFVSNSARGDLRNLLLVELATLCAPTLLECLRGSGLNYHRFAATVDLDPLFYEKPVLLRLIAVLTRQWIDSTTTFCERLSSDEIAVRELARTPAHSDIVSVTGGLSDRHHGGHSVLALQFGDGRKVLYKPKDVRVDAAWHCLVRRLNSSGAPIDLRAAEILSRQGYGWSEFVEHTGCRDTSSHGMYFRRAGALLALLHCFAASDMHHENIIASGEQPVPIDLEAILQDREQNVDATSPLAAHAAAQDLIADSVLAVGLLPGYARSVSGGGVTPVGGMADGWSNGFRVRWLDVNSHAMRPVMEIRPTPTSNLPHVSGRYVTIEEHLADFTGGFEDYLGFLQTIDWNEPLSWFSDTVVRKLHRPTQFYHHLLDRLRDDRVMGDGVMWSVQADFLARLADWTVDDDPLWAVQRRERDALLSLDIPHFQISAATGLRRASSSLGKLSRAETAWQCDLIRQTSSFRSHDATADDPGWAGHVERLSPNELVAEADTIADSLAAYSIRRGHSAAWLGLNWRPDSDAAHPAVLGHDLYGGNCGIALFLAAHSRVMDCPGTGELARAALTALRAEMKGSNASRISRLLGIGGATGLGSIAYALSVTATLLGDDGLRADARLAADLITDELIESDERFDVVGGSAGALLGLLRVYRDTGSAPILDRAARCGDHLLTRHGAATGAPGGMSHGAAGFAYAHGALSHATGDRRYAEEAERWLEAERGHRRAETELSPQWCHGAAGTGLALLAMTAAGFVSGELSEDITSTLAETTRAWPDRLDTLCCGTIGNIEMLLAAGQVDLALDRFSSVVAAKNRRGDYRWSGGSARFNVGLFRGRAGIGYSCLRLLDSSLPNVLVWE